MEMKALERKFVAMDSTLDVNERFLMLLAISVWDSETCVCRELSTYL